MYRPLILLLCLASLTHCDFAPKQEGESTNTPDSTSSNPALNDEERQELVKSLDEQIEELEERADDLESQKEGADEILAKELERAIGGTTEAIRRIREQRRKVIEEAMPNMDEVTREVDKVIDETSRAIEDAFDRWREQEQQPDAEEEGVE